MQQQQRKFQNFLLRSLAMVSMVCLISPMAMADGMVLKGNVSEQVTMSSANVENKGKGIIGVDLAIRPNRYPIVRDVFRYSPAHFAGIRPGDTVMAVDGNSTIGKSSAEVDASISDMPGRTVVLTVKRGVNVRNLDVTVTSLANAHPELKRYFVSYNRDY